MRRTDGFTFVMSWSFLAGAVATGLAWLVVPATARVVVVSGLGALVLACGAAVTARGPRRKSAVLVVGTIVAAGLVLAEREPTAIVGVGLLTLAVVLIPVLHYVSSAPARLRWSSVLVRVVVGAAVAAVPLSLVALMEDEGATFTVRYGQPVTVNASQDCVSTQIVDPGGGRTVSGTSCDFSSWTVGGSSVVGTLHAGYHELDGRDTPQTRHLAAYARGHDAFTPATVVVADWFAPLGFFPWWLIFGLPILMVIFGRRRPALPFRTTWAVLDR
jgi:hypothetical protein